MLGERAIYGWASQHISRRAPVVISFDGASWAYKPIANSQSGWYNPAMSSKDPVYLIDGNAYIYRAYHAVAPLSNKDGLPTHAVLGFTNILLRVIREKNPQYMAVAFDLKGPTFRHELFKDYKANRPPMPEDLVCQLPYIKEVVKANNILCLEQQGVEADDILASAARQLSNAGYEVILVSGDKDLLQLVSESINMWDPMSEKNMDPAAVKKKYGVEPASLLDLFSLIGDSADNIPGVAGVGPKTALKLIDSFGTLEGIYDNIDKAGTPKLRQRLADNREEAFLARQLIELKEDLDIPSNLADYLLGPADNGALRELYTKLEFSRLLKSEISIAAMDSSGFELVNNAELLGRLIEKIKQSDLLILDTETSSLTPRTTELVGVSLCVDGNAAYYIPLGHRLEEGEMQPGQLNKEDVLAALKPYFEDSTLPKMGHNLKFDFEVLYQQGISLRGPLWDTMIASYLLDPSRRSHKLDDLAEEFLQQRLTTFKEVTGNDRRQDAFVYVTIDSAKDYACEDVLAVFLLWQEFYDRLKIDSLWELFVDMEMALVPVLAEMERWGIRVEPAILTQMSGEFSQQIARLEKEIHGLAGGEFNINSPRQLGEILFEKLKLPHGRKIKTGYSTDAKVLEKLARYHDLPRAVMTHRNLSKLKSTYVDKLTDLIQPDTGRVHTSFNQTITATGRLSSSKPNLQNIPIRTAEGQRIRQAFVPETGCVFLSADYSQIDLRVLAHYSQDPALLAAFRDGKDVHRRTAAEVFRVNPEFITPEMRRVAKTINFGIVYGMSAFGLAGQLNLSRKEAATFIERYFAHYTGVKKYMVEIVEKARQDGFVTTLFKRRRLLPEIAGSNKMRREFAERTAINTPIQGTAADIIKLAMLEVRKLLGKNELKTRMILQIHDELVFEVPHKEEKIVAELVREAMETVVELDVPLVVNLSWGENLAKE